MRLPCFGLPEFSDLGTDIFLAETLRARPTDLSQEAGLQGPLLSPRLIWILFSCPLGCVAMLDHYKSLAEKACLMPQASCFLSYNLLSKLVSVMCGSEFKCLASCGRPPGRCLIVHLWNGNQCEENSSDWLEQPEVICCAAGAEGSSCFTECTELRVRQEWLCWNLEFFCSKRIKCPAAKTVNIYYATDSFPHITEYIGLKFMPRPND